MINENFIINDKDVVVNHAIIIGWSRPWMPLSCLHFKQQYVTFWCRPVNLDTNSTAMVIIPAPAVPNCLKIGTEAVFTGTMGGVCLMYAYQMELEKGGEA